MNINRHNYEEFFILYMDNELSSDDRCQVEGFVQKNPDLQEELDILLQYKLVPDTGIVFENKSQLIKQENNSPVNLANYEEWLVPYMDNELTAEQRTAVDQFIVNHPSAKEELATLLRIKLQPEKIVFANKESLYRRKENPDSYRDRSMPVRWLRPDSYRVAAAAILILAVSLTAIIVLNKKPSLVDEVAKTSNNGQKTNIENPVVTSKEKNKVVTQPEIANNVKQVTTPTLNQRTNNVVVNVKRSNSTNQKLRNNVPVPVKKEEPVIVENKQRPSNNLPQPLNNPNINNDASNKDVAIVNNNKEITKLKESITPPPVTTNAAEPSYAVLDQSDGKKNKLRGFFRKVTRTFEKNTNINATDDDDRVLIGGLAIKLK